MVVVDKIEWNSNATNITNTCIIINPHIAAKSIQTYDENF